MVLSSVIRRRKPPLGCRRVVRLSWALLFVLAKTHTALAQTVDPALWVTDGAVNSVVHYAGTIYIGGSFNHVQPITGSAVALDASTGAARQPYPEVIGPANSVAVVTASVSAVVPDGSGGWYIGGSFTSVRGQARRGLAQLDADGNVTSWNPDVNGTVSALALSGGTIFAGGSFTSIGGQARNNIAALEAATGAATSWNPNASGPDPYGASVYALAVSGATVYVGGDFKYIGGQPRNSIAALDAATGAATSWNPDLRPSNGGVLALMVNGSTVYAGGGFDSIGRQPRNNIAALDAATGVATAWNPNATRLVYTLAMSGGTVYAGGLMDSIGGQARTGVAALDAATGVATSWNPNASGNYQYVITLAVSGSTIYVGGGFTGIGGQPRKQIAALDATTGAATGWDPNATLGPYLSAPTVLALAVSGGTVYAGGTFLSIGGRTRNNIAALDVASGAATSWDPDANGDILALSVVGGTVYAGGDFTSIGGQPRNHIAALDAANGTATSWNPDANGGVVVLAVSGSTVYAGGSFTDIGGHPRSRIAALDAATGAPTDWNPDANGIVRALAVGEGTVYVGGGFNSIGRQPRSFIAGLDAATGAATSWDPNANNVVLALAVSGGTAYAGGHFTSIGGQNRNSIAAVDAATGVATNWNPNADGAVRTIVASGNTVYASGAFGHIGGQRRFSIAALDAATGTATIWDAKPNNYVNTLAVSGSTVYAGGNFRSIGGLPHSGIAAMTDDTTPTLLSLVSAQAEPGRVRLTWFAEDKHGLTATVYRHTVKEVWGVVGEISTDGTGRLVFEDTRVIPGERYGYRLGILVHGSEEFLGETWVDVPRAPEFALAGLRPNPTSSALVVALSLPDAAPARLELLDLAGRRMLVRDVGALGGGSHVVALAEPRRIAPGLYLLRLVRDGRALMVRAIVVR